jgi:Uma2 family endonuclease
MSTAEAITDPTPVVWTEAEFDRMVSLGILPANHSRQGVRFTRDQYRTMAEHGFFDGRNVCLLRGEVIEMAAMKEPHVSGVSAVSHALRVAFGVGFHVRVQAPLDVQTANDPEPDVVVVPGDFRTYRDSPTAPPAADALIIVEVAHTTLDQDITTKAEVYATAGIADYWVVDVENNRLLVFRDPQPIAAGGVAYRTRLTRYAGDTITPLAAPNVPIPVADLLP